MSNATPRWLWEEDDLTKFWLKSNGRWLILLKITSWACLLASVLKFTFHCKAQSLILLKSLFKSVVVGLIFYTTGKREVSSANNFWFEFKSSGKSLIQIKKNIHQYLFQNLCIHLKIEYLVLSMVVN